MKGTINVCSDAIKKSPYWTTHLPKTGWELACASKRWAEYHDVSPEVEDQHIREAIGVMQALNGDPKGALGAASLVREVFWVC